MQARGAAPERQLQPPLRLRVLRLSLQPLPPLLLRALFASVSACAVSLAVLASDAAAAATASSSAASLGPARMARVTDRPLKKGPGVRNLVQSRFARDLI
jgi:hypothetical protein